MTRIAHLSDIHLGLPGRRERLDRALLHASIYSHHVHLCLTGDLTESGLLRDFEDLADALRHWDPRQVTICPGNHDLGALSWPDVLRGTGLGRFSATSLPGALFWLSDCSVYSVSTQYQRRALAFRALGKIPETDLQQIAVWSKQWPSRPFVVCMHHPPTSGPLRLFEGLTNKAAVLDLLQACPNVHLLCGHDHERQDIGRIHVAPSVADDDDPLRLYDVRGPDLVVVR